jgi:hypothetical protein
MRDLIAPAHWNARPTFGLRAKPDNLESDIAALKGKLAKLDKSTPKGCAVASVLSEMIRAREDELAARFARGRKGERVFARNR